MMNTRFQYTDTYYVDQPHSKIIDLFAMEYTYSQLEPYTTHIKTNNEQDPLVSLRVEIEEDRVEKKLFVTVYIDGEMLGVGDPWDAGALYHLRALCGLNDLKQVSQKKTEANISVYDPDYDEEEKMIKCFRCDKDMEKNKENQQQYIDKTGKVQTWYECNECLHEFEYDQFSSLKSYFEEEKMN